MHQRSISGNEAMRLFEEWEKNAREMEEDFNNYFREQTGQYK